MNECIEISGFENMADTERRTSHKGIKLHRRLGQHLLNDKIFIDRIISESCISRDDNIFEVGAGPGNLTERLLEAAKNVITVEIDGRFRNDLEILRKKYPERLTVIYQDVLKIKMDEVLGTGNVKWKVLANIPYYITSPLLELFLLKNRLLFTDLYLTVQKEIAQRICPGSDKDRSSLSIFVDYYAKTRILFDIPPEAFTPPPNVNSAFVHLELRKVFTAKAVPDLIFRIVKKAFGQRRKAIKNSLKGLYPLMNESRIQSLLIECGINPMTRPQNLTVADFDIIALRFDEENS